MNKKSQSISREDALLEIARISDYMAESAKADRSWMNQVLIEKDLKSSAAMAAEILQGKTILEALNTDLVCDAINTAMRELFLQIVYGRTQSAFSDDGLAVGAGLEDLGKGLRSQGYDTPMTTSSASNMPATVPATGSGRKRRSPTTTSSASSMPATVPATGGGRKQRRRSQ